jgi:hypothetical protein
VLEDKGLGGSVHAWYAWLWRHQASGEGGWVHRAEQSGWDELCHEQGLRLERSVWDGLDGLDSFTWTGHVVLTWGLT